MTHSRILLLFALISLSLGFITTSTSSKAQVKTPQAWESISRENRNSKDQIRDVGDKYVYKRAFGTRIDRSKQNRCGKKCREKAEQEKITYFERVFNNDGLPDYQKELESKIFSDQKFVSKCWKRAIDKGIDFFFTVNESGKAADIAWFPKEPSAKCIKRYVKKIDFPQPEKPHHAWLVVTKL